MKLLETSYLVDYEQGQESARRYFDENEFEPLAVSTISLFELGFGVVWTGDGDLQRLLRSLQWAEFLDYSPQDALEGASIQSELQDAGSRIPIADMIIAGVARNRGATLVAKDDHFDRVNRLQVDFYAD